MATDSVNDDDSYERDERTEWPFDRRIQECAYTNDGRSSSAINTKLINRRTIAKPSNILCPEPRTWNARCGEQVKSSRHGHIPVHNDDVSGERLGWPIQVSKGKVPGDRAQQKRSIPPNAQGRVQDFPKFAHTGADRPEGEGHWVSTERCRKAKLSVTMFWCSRISHCLRKHKPC